MKLLPTLKYIVANKTRIELRYDEELDRFYVIKLVLSGIIDPDEIQWVDEDEDEAYKLFNQIVEDEYEKK